MTHNPSNNKKKLKKRDWEIFKKTSGICPYCNNKMKFYYYGMEHKYGWNYEHIIPKSKGGMGVVENLTAAHIWCNWKRGNVEMNEEMKAEIQTFYIHKCIEWNKVFDESNDNRRVLERYIFKKY